MKLSCNFDSTMNIKKMLKSFGPAISGLIYLSKNENNFKFHLIAFLVVVIFGLMCNITRYEWCMVLISSSIVLLSEGINTAIERIADLVETTNNPKIKVIKDVAAASVLISALFSIVIGILIFFPYLKIHFFAV